MRYLKMFESYQSESEVAEICKKFGIRNWYLERGLINVDGNVNLRNMGLTHIPLKFGEVTGYFSCSVNRLTSLDGCPIQVGGSFYCDWNNLTSLEGCPIRVGSYFACDNNKLTSLESCPKYVGGNFWCSGNKIREFTGIKYIESGLYCPGNPIFNIWEIISPNCEWDEDQMVLFDDCSVIQDDGEAVAIDRLNFFLEEIGLPTVKKVEGYINI